MEQTLYDNYVMILKDELIPATGCTEPIAVAYAGALARRTLGAMPDRIAVACSGNIIKNVMGVVVPGSGGLRGVDAAAILGVVGGDPDGELEVLRAISASDIEKTKALLADGFCACRLAEDEESLYIRVDAFADGHVATAEIRTRHNHVALIMLDGRTLFHAEPIAEEGCAGDRALLTVGDIYAFANEMIVDDLRECLDRQLSYNRAIAEEGLENCWGAQVGRTVLAADDGPKSRAIAAAAAASDARMGGCPMPVIINSGSGNQGITVSMPVEEYARSTGVDADRLYRALALANLILVHEKRFLGNLSAYCGAASAGCAAACGIAYLDKAELRVIGDTIVNALATIGGMVCDGAKPSCAAKIASAVETGLRAYDMAKRGIVFQGGEGLVEQDVEETIRNFGRMGREGMRATDIEILKIMLGQ